MEGWRVGDYNCLSEEGLWGSNDYRDIRSFDRNYNKEGSILPSASEKYGYLRTSLYQSRNQDF